MDFNEQKYLIWSKFIRQDLSTQSAFSQKRETSVPLNVLDSFTHDPSSAMSKILAATTRRSAAKRAFIDLPTHKLSSLVPHIQLYKVIGDNYQPFHFPRYHQEMEIESIMSEGGRLSGSGITAFGVTFEGKDTFTSDKLLRCNLTFFVQNMKSLFDPPQSGFAPLAELITARRPNEFIVNTTNKAHAEQINKPRSIEIKADIGWAVYPEMSETFTPEEIEAVKTNSMSLRLTLVDHNINFSQEGTLTIDANYIGRLESMLDNKTSDLLVSSEDLTYFGEINKQVEISKKKAKANDSIISEDEQALIETETQTNLINNYSRILERLDPEQKSFIFTREITLAEEEEFFKSITKEKKKKGDFKAAAVREATGTPPLIQPKNKRASKRKRADLAERTIHYIYLADLLEQVLMVLKENYAAINDAKTKKQLETFRIILATFRLSIVEEKTGTDISSGFYSLGEFPISMRTYSEWFRDNVIKPGKVKFSFLSFIESMISDLVFGALNKMNYRDAPIINDNVKFGATSLVSLDGHGKLKGKPGVKAKDMPDFSSTMSTTDFDNDVDYLVFYSYVAGASSQKNKSGNVKKDQKDGVYHLYLGQNKGLIKTINFSKVDLKYRKEFLIANSYSLFDELRLPYNADITMFGNTIFRPGSQLYINPSTIGLGDPRNKNSPAVRLGLGGYYSVTTLDINLSNTTFETTLRAVFTGWPEAKGVGGALSKQVARQAEAQDQIDRASGNPESRDSATAAFKAPLRSADPYASTSPADIKTADQIFDDHRAAAKWAHAHAPKKHLIYDYEKFSRLKNSQIMISVNKRGEKKKYRFIFDDNGEIIKTQNN